MYWGRGLAEGTERQSKTTLHRLTISMPALKNVMYFIFMPAKKEVIGFQFSDEERDS